jgi:hypothetical protein
MTDLEMTDLEMTDLEMKFSLRGRFAISPRDARRPGLIGRTAGEFSSRFFETLRRGPVILIA